MKRKITFIVGVVLLGSCASVSKTETNDAGESLIMAVDTADNDQDGILNVNDSCINRTGIEAFYGCPSQDILDKVNTKWASGDSDGDGVLNINDVCPSEAGLISLNGCPDMDGDLVPDYLDECPEIKGLKELKGCPVNGSGILGDDTKDSDGDGVPDHLDKCPTVKGEVELKGCPKVKE
jgi:hypothetical protein